MANEADEDEVSMEAVSVALVGVETVVEAAPESEFDESGLNSLYPPPLAILQILHIISLASYSKPSP